MVGKKINFKKWTVHAVMCISGILIVILLMPAGICFLLIFLVWKMTDKIIHFLED